MIDLFLIALLLAVLAGAGWYIYRAKKKGSKCIGCPAGGCVGCKYCPK